MLARHVAVIHCYFILTLRNSTESTDSQLKAYINVHILMFFSVNMTMYIQRQHGDMLMKFSDLFYFPSLVKWSYDSNWS